MVTSDHILTSESDREQPTRLAAYIEETIIRMPRTFFLWPNVFLYYKERHVDYFIARVFQYTVQCTLSKPVFSLRMEIPF